MTVTGSGADSGRASPSVAGRPRLERIALFPNLDKPFAAGTVEKLSAWLQSMGRVVVGTPVLKPILHRGFKQVAEAELAGAADLVVVLGGDGTLLAAARLMAGSGVPILGVNLGGLGFLTEVRDRDLFGVLERVLGGEFEVEDRIMIDVAVKPAAGGALRPIGVGLNDAVVHSGSSSRLIELRLEIDGQRVGEFRADGLAVSTPTGSTAYALSAGGPIVRPTIPALIATPICPHSLAVRPFLFADTETLQVRVGPAGAQLAVDGALTAPIGAEDEVIVKRAAEATRLVLARPRSFYSLVRTKLHWGGLKVDDAQPPRRP